jgi:hypothetical protein
MNPNQKQPTEDLTLSYDAPLEMAPDGRHPILCVDVFETWPEDETWDNGKTWKNQRKLMFVFQVFPEDGSKDQYGDVYRIEYKVNFSFAPAGPNTNASRLWTFAESWLGHTFSTKSARFDPKIMIGKAAWGYLEQKTRWTQINSVEPYNDDDGNPLPVPKAEPYTRREYPHPDTWKSKKEQSQAQAQAQSNTNPYDPIPNSKPVSVEADALPF